MIKRQSAAAGAAAADEDDDFSFRTPIIINIYNICHFTSMQHADKMSHSKAKYSNHHTYESPILDITDKLD